MEMPDGFRFDSRPLCSGYFVTLDVIDAITLEAILNCAWRSLIPCRRAIQLKSVLRGPDLAFLVLEYQEPRPVEPGVGIRCAELRSRRRIAEDQQHRRPQRDSGAVRELRLIDVAVEPDALVTDVRLQTCDRLAERITSSSRYLPHIAAGMIPEGADGDRPRQTAIHIRADLSMVQSTKFRVRHQPANGASARHRGAAGAARHRRRGDRVGV